MSSSELLSIMKKRNRLVSNLDQREEEDEDDLFRPDGQEAREDTESVQQGDMDLLTDIRNFLAFQVSSKVWCLIVKGQHLTYRVYS